MINREAVASELQATEASESRAKAQAEIDEPDPDAEAAKAAIDANTLETGERSDP